MTPAYLDARESAAFLGVGLRTLHKLRNDPTFPQPRCFGERATRWKASELESWADTRTGSKKPEPVALTAARATKRGSKGGASGGTTNTSALDRCTTLAAAERVSVEPPATPAEAAAA